ncbi:MAG TPA: hypothetical protein VGO48_00155 [Conexibacter sp.]|nr:hypothetical protein [Conexibacter sp.]
MRVVIAEDSQSDEGLEAAATIRAELPGTGVLVLSHHADEHYARRLLEHGAEGVGYLLKDRVAEIDLFLDAVRRVGTGGSALDPEVVAPSATSPASSRSSGCRQPASSTGGCWRYSLTSDSRKLLGKRAGRRLLVRNIDFRT